MEFILIVPPHSSPIYLEYIDPCHGPEHEPADHEGGDHDAHQPAETQEARGQVRHGVVVEVAVPHLGQDDCGGYEGLIASRHCGVN